MPTDGSTSSSRDRSARPRWASSGFIRILSLMRWLPPEGAVLQVRNQREGESIDQFSDCVDERPAFVGWRDDVGDCPGFG